MTLVRPAGSTSILTQIMGDEEVRGRHDRELIELLNELRVALPGIQVLFAFLLTVPFSQGYRSGTARRRPGRGRAPLTYFGIAQTAIPRFSR